MASCSLIILCPNGRRVTVKIGPNSPLLSALEQACQKQGYNAENCELRRGKTVIDLSQPFRFSGLTNNAKLDMVQSTTVRQTGGEVCVSVQTESGDRVQGVYPSSTPLWNILDSLGLVPVVTEDNELVGAEPSIVYMRQQVTGKERLSATTLKALGVSSGRVSLRFVFTKPTREKVAQESNDSKQEQQKMDPVIVDLTGQEEEKEGIEETAPKMAVDSIHNHGDEDEVKSKPVCCNSDIEFPVLPFSVFPTENDSRPHQENMETDTPTDRMETDEGNNDHARPHPHATLNAPEGDYNSGLAVGRLEGTITVEYYKQIMSQLMRRQPSQEAQVVYEGPCDRNPVIYSLDDSLPVPVADISDDFFEPTIEDVQKMQQDLQRNVKELADAPLLTKEMRDMKRQCSYDQTVIRVILPDKMVLQGTFNTGESLKSLVKFVREHLRNNKMKFVLYTTPPKEVLRSAQPRFCDKGFYPAANIHLSVTDGALEEVTSPLLSDASIAQYKMGHVVAEQVASRLRPSSVKGSSDDSTTTGGGKDSGGRVVSTGNYGENKLPPRPSSNKSNSKSSSSKPVPKWFNVGIKK